MDLKKSPSNRRAKRTAGGSGAGASSNTAYNNNTVAGGASSSGNTITNKNSSQEPENHWDCSVCTYRNTFDAFKCLMCDVRKGTSTRKPRINQVAQQFNQQFNQQNPSVAKAQKKEKSEKKLSDRDRRISTKRKIHHLRKLRNVDRTSAETREVTVNNITVMITEYKPKSSSNSNHSTTSGHQNSDSESGSEAPSADSDSRSSMVKLSLN